MHLHEHKLGFCCNFIGSIYICAATMLNQNANHPRLIPTDSIQPFGAQMLTCCEPLCHGHACTFTYLFSRNKQGQNKQAPGNPKLHQRDSVAMLNKRKVSSWCVCVWRSVCVEGVSSFETSLQHRVDAARQCEH